MNKAPRCGPRTCAHDGGRDCGLIVDCQCAVQNRAPYPATCGRCGGEVVPGCACRADVQGPGACEALVPAFGDLCDFCQDKCVAPADASQRAEDYARILMCNPPPASEARLRAWIADQGEDPDALARRVRPQRSSWSAMSIRAVAAVNEVASIELSPEDARDFLDDVLLAVVGEEPRRK